MYQKKRAGSKGKLKEKIIIAAREIFAEYGYFGAPTELIAKRAGVSKGLLFWHFHNKDELILEVAKSVLPGDVIRECLNEGVEGKDLLRLIGKRYLQKYSDNVERRLFINTMSIQSFYPELAKEAMEPCTNLLQQVSLKVYGKVDTETIITLRAFLGGLMCYVMNPLNSVSQEHYVETLTEIVMQNRS